MAFIELRDDGEHAAEDRAALGYVPNYSRLIDQRPAVYAAWKQLNGAIKSTMDPRRYELATVAAASRLRSSYCTLAHGKVLLQWVDPEELRAIVEDHRTAGLDPTEVAVMDLAAKVADDAGSVTQAEVDDLRERGLSDVDVLDVVLTAAARSFFSKTLDALAAEPDAAYRGLEPDVREALTVGRQNVAEDLTGPSTSGAPTPGHSRPRSGTMTGRPYDGPASEVTHGHRVPGLLRPPATGVGRPAAGPVPDLRLPGAVRGRDPARPHRHVGAARSPPRTASSTTGTGRRSPRCRPRTSPSTCTA